MAKYLLLLRDVVSEEPPDPEAMKEMFKRFVAWTEALQERRELVSVERLTLDSEAKVLRRKHGTNVVVDGPYTETRETIVGLFIVEAASVEEATTIAQGCPGLDGGVSIEVRAIGAFPKPN